MQAYIYLLAKRPKGRWPKAHWFFDGPRNLVLTAACGLRAAGAAMYPPTANYFINGEALKHAWCLICQDWMKRHRDELMTHERLVRR